MSTEKKLTPMMQQFFEMKGSYPDTILFFRMGDFYEMFGDDAVVASKILGIALTRRNKDDDLMMCGVPHHAYENYMVKLLKAGKKVAICEQLEDPRFAKGLVKRGVTRVVTPATVVEEAALTDFTNNFLLSIHAESGVLYLAAIDISTGEVFLQQSPMDEAREAAVSWRPKEIISDMDIALPGHAVQVRPLRGGKEGHEELVSRAFGVNSTRSLGLDDAPFVSCLALALTYLEDIMLSVTLSRPQRIIGDERLVLDSIAARTLELTESSDGSSRHTLFSVLNRCQTAMGSRMLHRALLAPLRSLPLIHRRQSIIECLLSRSDIRSALTDALSGIYDIERIVSRITSGRAHARDLVWLKNSIAPLPIIRGVLEHAGHPMLTDLAEAMGDVADIRTLIERAIVDSPPLALKEGGIIREGFNKYVDELNGIKQNSRQHLLAIEVAEKERTGISSLRVNYNKVFGYYIEVSKSNLSKVPEHFERKQTLVNAERFITAELKDLETKILHADEKLSGMEYDLFCEVRDYAASHAERVRAAARALSEVDMLLSLAEVAVRNRYVRPVVDDSSTLTFTGGRHPVVEAESGEPFVANDLVMDDTENRLLLITGPNMAGKSTYIRMTALIALMAHVGSFVPADSAHVGLLDRIFTRVGASDNLARGESTFMVEMTETANILSNATKRSLIVLDEIGRGTSTFDGLSIAWAVVEHILTRIGAKTLFATHYHELTDIPVTIPGAKNYNVEVREWKGDILFQRRIIPGSADRSYGIHVGKLAGLPAPVLERANELLAELEKNEFDKNGVPKLAHTKKTTHERIIQPILVFDENPVTEELKRLNLDNLTPLQALTTLARLKGMLDE